MPYAEIAPDVTQFFVTFERASAGTDVDALAGCFLDSFLVGDAQSTRPVPRAAFLQALPGRSAAAAAAGIGPAVLIDLIVDVLDDHWVLARTRWSAPRTGDPALEMASTFLLQRQDGRLRIAAYLNHEGLGLRPGTAPSVPAPQTASVKAGRLNAADGPPRAVP